MLKKYHITIIIIIHYRYSFIFLSDSKCTSVMNPGGLRVWTPLEPYTSFPTLEIIKKYVRNLI